MHYVVNNAEYRSAGTTFQGCIGKTTRYPVFTDNFGYGKFIDMQILMNGSKSGTYGAPPIFQSKNGSGPMRGIDISGHFQIENYQAASSSILSDLWGANIDIVVNNNSAYAYTLKFDSYYKGASGSSFKIRAKGLVAFNEGGYSATDITDGVKTDIYIECADATKVIQNNGNLVSIGTPHRSHRVRLKIHSAIVK